MICSTAILMKGTSFALASLIIISASVKLSSDQQMSISRKKDSQTLKTL